MTLLVYAFDKMAAGEGVWRTKESSLYWLSLVGGWPGALVAQQTFRHKFRKVRFRMAFCFTMIINCGVPVWIYTANGLETLRAWIADGAGLFGGGHTVTI